MMPASVDFEARVFSEQSLLSWGESKVAFFRHSEVVSVHVIGVLRSTP